MSKRPKPLMEPPGVVYFMHSLVAPVPQGAGPTLLLRRQRAKEAERRVIKLSPQVTAR